MTNPEEHFTMPGKYYIDKFFEKINKIVSAPKNINLPIISKKLQNEDYQLKQNYNRMQNK
ncbi:MAG: hypothetical protein Q8O84_02200 [Nanoarchaeota archaeon]|nr:hypothetical protein [Nanoarchaeota archaeon]